MEMIDSDRLFAAWEKRVRVMRENIFSIAQGDPIMEVSRCLIDLAEEIQRVKELSPDVPG